MNLVRKYLLMSTVGQRKIRILWLMLLTWQATSIHAQVTGIFKAGAALSNITPTIGTSVNGYFQDRLISDIHDELHARAIVLDDGHTHLAMVVSDLCILMGETATVAKQRAHEITGIPTENMMLSATHTHFAGTACAIFQSDPDPEYLTFIEERIADAIVRAYNNLTPARIGWGFGHEETLVFNRRWKMKAGTKLINPFGTQDQVKMNPGINNPDLLEPAGPIDPNLPIVSIQSLEGEHIALLANYSLHYVGGVPSGEASADYFAVFANRMEELLNARDQQNPFVGIMSNGTSGDINNIDFSGKYKQSGVPYAQMEYVANRLAIEALKVIQNIEYQNWVSLKSAQKNIVLGVRRPNQEEIDRAKNIIAKAESPIMKTAEEIYARETMFMKDYPTEVPVLLQTFIIGDLAIAAIPCESFATIGLELKDESPYESMFTISLANGYHGYLPTPEQHALGGYETWRARSSHLEVEASTKIIKTILELLNSFN